MWGMGEHVGGQSGMSQEFPADESQSKNDIQEAHTKSRQPYKMLKKSNSI